MLLWQPLWHDSNETCHQDFWRCTREHWEMNSLFHLSEVTSVSCNSKYYALTHYIYQDKNCNAYLFFLSLSPACLFHSFHIYEFIYFELYFNFQSQITALNRKLEQWRLLTLWRISKLRGNFSSSYSLFL